jgi:putative peptide zinc metalloprotease protein
MSMRPSLFSPLWHRVSDLHPRLRRDARVQRQQYRDQLWYQIIDAGSERQFRLNGKAYQFIGRCDGRHSVQEIWDALLHEQHDEAPTQDEVIRVLAQLDEQELLVYETTPDARTLVKRRDRRARQVRRGFLNPLAFRVSLGDPSALIRRLDWLGAIVLHPGMLWLWICAMGVAAAAAASNWHSLAVHATTYMNTPHCLLLAWVCFPFIKLLHELGHALAVRHWGADVRQAGLTLFVLVPAPYVDASAAAGFRSRHQRLVVSAIGIMVELTLAAFALLLWLNVQSGLVSDIAFVTMFIGSVSTVLFNGNPLMTFDGYYVLCDALDLPNLASRSKAYWAERLQCWALGSVRESGIQYARGEGKWLVLYAPLSAVYRIFVSALIVFWIGSQSVVLGVLAATYMLFALCVKPLWKAVSWIAVAAPAGAARVRARAMAGAGAAGFLILLFAIPFPSHTLARGVVWLPEQAQIRAQTDGFVAKMLVRDGELVQEGEILLVMQDPELMVERDVLARKLAGLQAGQFSALLRDPGRAQNLEQDIVSVESELGRADERIGQLTVRAQLAGRLAMPRQVDLPGRFFRRGERIGYVLASEQIGVRAAVPEYEVDLMREATRRITVRLADSPGELLAAERVREVPAATNELPSAALGDRGGGSYVTDPADKDALHTLEPLVLIDVKLPAMNLQRVGARAWVRFDHDAQPLAQQSYRRLRQLFLRHFNPTG